MKRLISVIMIVGLGLFSTQAHAGFMIEPYIGLGASGDWEYSTDSGSTDGDYDTDIAYGLRIGMSTLGLSFGAEFQSGTNTIPADPDVAGDEDDEYTPTNIGVFVGYTFPVMFRVFAGYVLDSTLKTEFSSGGDLQYKGDGIKFGVGYTGLPIVTINLEMQQLSYEEAEVCAATGLCVTTDTGFTLDANQTMLTIGAMF